METVCFSETLVSIEYGDSMLLRNVGIYYKSTRRCNPEDQQCHLHRSEKLRFQKLSHYRHAGYKEIGPIAPTHFFLCTRWGWVFSVTPQPHFTPRERTPPDPLNRRLGVWTQMLGEKSFGSAGDRTPFVQFVVRHYWLSHPSSHSDFKYNLCFFLNLP
jgi:hypothetical protein